MRKGSETGDPLPALIRVSSLQFLLRPDDGSVINRNYLPIKRVSNGLLVQIEALNKTYPYINTPTGMLYIKLL
jgi:hypothetical protein